MNPENPSMSTNSLISRIQGQGLSDVLPEHMDAQLITTVAQKLAKWRCGELVDTTERVELEEFSQHWGTIVLPRFNPSLAEALYETQNCVLAVLMVMSELDYLVQQECISRELCYRTYKPIDMFNVERLAYSVPQFATTFFQYNGMAPFAHEGVRKALTTSVERFLSHRLAKQPVDTNAGSGIPS